MPWGTPVTLIGTDAEEVAAAQRQMVRIGIDRLAGATSAPVTELAGGELETYRRVEFVDLADGVDGTILDVRQENEREESAIPGSLHVPIHEVIVRMDEIPRDATLWVHCASGFRAAIAASLLHRADYDVVLVDDDYSKAEELGLSSS
jgi:rhodanese-related sulfurtransferase